MNKLRKELELLKSWGIESISVDKILSMIKKEEDDINTSSKEQDTEIPSATVTTFPVGGPIFYIDDTADGVYEFFDAEGNLLQNVRVGDRPYAYRVVEKGSKDKYYVYHDGVYNNLRWAYFRDKDYVYESLGTYKNIGSGKTNTEKAMTKDGGAYVTANSAGHPTIWHQLQQVRNAKVGGCDDWFVPSTDETGKLRRAIKSGIIVGGTIAGSCYETSVFNSEWLWSSSECYDQGTWVWGYTNQYWYYDDKGNYNSVFFVRAF